MSADERLPLPDQPMLDPVANWQWLAHVMGRDHALVVSDGDAPFARALACGFTRQTVVMAEDVGDALAGGTLPFDSGEFDCVAIVDAEAMLGSFTDAPSARSAFGELRRVLKSTNGIYVGFERVGGRRDVRGAGRVHRLRASPQQRWLKRSGFVRLRSYYVEPSPQRPFSIIPAAARSVRAWERLARHVSWRDQLRQAVASVGLHPLLFEHRLVIGSA
jgi:hypothetical protein